MAMCMFVAKHNLSPSRKHTLHSFEAVEIVESFRSVDKELGKDIRALN